MKLRRAWSGITLALVLVFGLSLALETGAWARAGGGGSFGSRGGRSFSSPSMPSRPSSPGPSFSSPGMPGSSSGGAFSRSPFLQGMAGGLAGGFLGNMLFGGRGYAGSPGGVGGGGGGMGFLDLIILGLLAYFGWKFFKRRQQASYSSSAYQDSGAPRIEGSGGFPYAGTKPPGTMSGDVQQGLEQIRRYDPGFSEESFKEKVQDIFFRIQAAWMNRNMSEVEDLLTPEMIATMRGQLDQLKAQGQINRLENIAIRRVEPTEAWQEMGKDYITVLFTANLLDYTVSDTSGAVVSGDKLNPVKFQEFWTFVRDSGAPRWQLSAINQAG